MKNSEQSPVSIPGPGSFNWAIFPSREAHPIDSPTAGEHELHQTVV